MIDSLKEVGEHLLMVMGAYFSIFVDFSLNDGLTLTMIIYTFAKLFLLAKKEVKEIQANKKREKQLNDET